MKKLFVFAIAAVAMTVACQKLQDVNLGTENEGDLVEMRFNSNLVTVSTKSVSSLDAANPLYVYGLSSNGKRQVINAEATVTGNTLTLAQSAFYDSKGTYSFYGYYLDGANVTGDLAAEYASALPISITGANDVLLATATGNGTYSAAEARNGNHPELVFEHKLSKFTFSVVNLGNSTMELTDITVETPLSGTVTLTGAQTLDVDAQAAAGTIDLNVNPMTLASQASEVAPVYEEVASVEALVFPNSTYTLKIKLSQTGETGNVVTRTLPVTVTESIAAGFQYTFKIKLYSLEEIKITASLKDWEDATVEIDTSDIEEE